MHLDSTTSPFPPAGTDLGALVVDVSADANDRYWRGAGIEHSARREHQLFPLMAVNFTILLVQRTVPTGVLHTREHLEARASASAPASLTVRGRVTDRFEKRGRDYFVVSSSVEASDGTVLWESVAELAASLPRAGAAETDTRGEAPARRDPPIAAGERRRLLLDAGLLRTYSRAGNFHSDDEAAQAMGLPGMTAMGMQTLGPAYGIALDAWGADLVARGRLDAAFFGLVLEDDEVEASVDRDGPEARFAIRNVRRDRITASGRISVP